jgi:hypothetical protein
MNKQTAVQWLYDELFHCLHREEVCDLVYKLEQKVKEMERQQIVDAWNDGDYAYFYSIEGKEFEDGDEYYTEKFGDHSVDANEMIDHIADVSKMVGGKDEK